MVYIIEHVTPVNGIYIYFGAVDELKVLELNLCETGAVKTQFVAFYNQSIQNNKKWVLIKVLICTMHTQ